MKDINDKKIFSVGSTDVVLPNDHFTQNVKSLYGITKTTQVRKAAAMEPKRLWHPDNRLCLQQKGGW